LQLLSWIRAGFLALFSQKTLGARALIIKDGQILLVQHTYSKGWYTVGGGVEKNESPLEALKRELYEEVGIKPTAPPKLFAVYHRTRCVI
jgi:8-oxo-dGTP pyrophosphatase MutT (NUDIX family)